MSRGPIVSVVHLLVDRLMFSYCSDFVGRLKPILVDAFILHGGEMRGLLFKS